MAAATSDNDDAISAINVTPFVDIVLVLLIILMVTSTSIVKASLAVELPKAATGEPTVNSTLALVLTKEGDLYLNNDKTDDAALRAYPLLCDAVRNLHDHVARPGKRSGAWMNALRWQAGNTADGQPQTPVILNTNNFARGEAGSPTLLSLEDARTLFHEFGHGLHGLLSEVRYQRLSGTQVLRDFVELPSQIFEHWIAEPEVLRRHARHWQTGEPIPDELIERLQRARRFNQGYETVRYTASALLDLALHARAEAEPPEDVCAWEAAFLADAGLPGGCGVNHRLVHFQHLFAGSSYAAGYYVYLWAEVLDADGYDAFAEAGGPFDAEVAERLRRHVYAAGNRVEPNAAFEAFRGRPPRLEPLLAKRGLLEAASAPAGP
jgi:peptidyl-dipeptidase Dcp